ncbi:MAG TPA: hypothetical protein VKZ51_03580 [Cyclobacteriaceae bacterium]|nr:hypothetical protein [Cyclobacteriaceae bacterium]
MKAKALLILSLLLTWISTPLLACEVCKSQQPKVTQNITHGAGPQGDTDFIIIAIAIAIVLLTLVFSIKFLWKPGEDSPRHIKRVVLNNY